MVSATRLGAFVGLALLCAYPASGADLAVTDCTDLDEVLEESCVDGNTITLATGLECSVGLAFIEGECMVRAEEPCGAAIYNGGSNSAIILGDADFVVEGLTLTCNPERSASYLLYSGEGAITIADACLDGGMCSSGVVGASDDEFVPGPITLSRSSMTGPAVSLPVGGASVLIEDSILQTQPDQPSPTIDTIDVPQIEIQRSLFISASDDVPVLQASGQGELTLAHDAFVVTGAEAAARVEDGDEATTRVVYSVATAEGATGPALAVESGILELSGDLFYAFEAAVDAGGATRQGESNLWVDVDSPPDGVEGRSFASAEEAGLATLGQAFCVLPPDCPSVDDCSDEAVCLDELALWPADSCSALVVSDDGAYQDLIGLLGGQDLSEAPSDPPWSAAAVDEDGDGWPDLIDLSPDDEGHWRPSWYALDGQECLYADNTCASELDLALTWTSRDPGVIPSECKEKPESYDMLSVGHGCGERTLRASALLVPCLLLLRRRRASASSHR